jgi:hypothetical protein
VFPARLAGFNARIFARAVERLARARELTAGSRWANHAEKGVCTMRLSNVVAATAALSLIAVPAFAAPANPASKLSLVDKDARAGAKVRNGNKAKGTTWALGLGVVAVVVIAAVALGSNKDSTPASS